MSFCERVRRLRPDVVFGADIIAGFPTETEDMFAARSTWSMNAGSRSCTYFRFHRDPARRRRACRRSTVPSSRNVRGASAKRVNLRCAATSTGRSVARRRVLTESKSLGRTEQFLPVRLAAPIEPGVMLDVTMKAHDGRQLLAA